MNKSSSQHAVTGVFTFTLLGIFALLSALLVLLGARFFQSHSERVTLAGDERILSSYMRSALRQADTLDGVRVEDADGICVVSIRSEYGGEIYYTRYYCYEGYLREWFSSESHAFRPSDGDVICACADMQAVREGNLLRVTLEDTGGNRSETDIALRCALTGGEDE